jgi:Arm DNA-binding domain
MTVQEPSASSVRLASTALPDSNVIPLPQPKPERTLRRPFTKTSVSKMCCPAGKREALFWDASCRGFGLRALPSGHRTWIYQYRNEHKRTRRIALGDVTAVPLEAARRSARQLAANK